VRILFHSLKKVNECGVLLELAEHSEQEEAAFLSFPMLIGSGEEKLLLMHHF
jgi:hypothetical protein